MKKKIDFGDLVTLPIEWFLVGMLVMFYIMSWEQEEVMQEYVDDLYLKLSKEEFIEEYVKAKNKQHTLVKDYDLYLANCAMVRAFESQIAFMTIYERGYRYDKDKNMIVKSEKKKSPPKRGRRAVGKVN